jgi:putative oxidoreductase
MTARWALVPLRIMLAIGFVMHGESKLVHGPEQFARILEALGVPRAHEAAWATILVEIIGGVSLLLGAYVRPAAVVLAGVLATAIVGVHWQYGFLAVRLIDVTASGARFGPVGYELALVYLAALAALALGEPTPWSVDRWRRARKTA